MRYGWKCENDGLSQNITSFGCWGGLAFGDTSREVISIQYEMDSCYGNASAAGYLVEKFQKKNPQMSTQQAKREAYEVICNTLFRNQVKWEISEDNVLTVSDFGEMPRNHLMFYLFALRCSLKGAYNKKVLMKALADQGVKSDRKLIIGSLLGCVQTGMKGLSSIGSIGSGGQPFLTSYTTVQDVLDVYRGNKLKGPKDHPWKVGGGYTSGGSGCCVQISSCSKVTSHARDLIVCRTNHPKKVTDIYLCDMGIHRKDGRTVENALQNLTKFLKSMK